MINSIGDEDYRIFARWNIPALAISYQELVERFEELFQSREYLIFVTRHRILSLEQLFSEVIKDFIDRLTRKAKYRYFRTLEEAMILQIITKGLCDDKLRKNLLYTKYLDINKAENICHLYHSTESSNVVLTGGADTEVSLVKSRGPK